MYLLSKALPVLPWNRQALGRQMSGKTYSGEEWAGGNMKLEVIDYLSTAGRPKSKPSTVESEGEKKEIDFLFVPPRGGFR